MDFVYGYAFITIIAACGNSANAGLSGARRYFRARTQPVESIGPGFRLMFAQHLMEALDKSVYKTRAWTYVRFAREICIIN